MWASLQNISLRIQTLTLNESPLRPSRLKREVRNVGRYFGCTTTTGAAQLSPPDQPFKGAKQVGGRECGTAFLYLPLSHSKRRPIMELRGWERTEQPPSSSTSRSLSSLHRCYEYPLRWRTSEEFSCNHWILGGVGWAIPVGSCWGCVSLFLHNFFLRGEDTLVNFGRMR